MDKKLYKLLKIISKHDKIFLTDLSIFLKKNYNDISEDIDWLLSHQYIDVTPNIFTSNNNLSNEDEIFITTSGRVALIEYKTSVLRYRLMELRNWLSFIISVIALSLSLYNFFTA